MMKNVTPVRKPRVAVKAKATVPAAKPAPARKAVPAKKAVAEPKAAGKVVDKSVGKAKPKLVRDSFTIPKSEYLVLDALKQRAATLARPTKKSELIRAGINALNAMSDKAFLAVLGTVPSLKTGRPAKSSPD